VRGGWVNLSWRGLAEEAADCEPGGSPSSQRRGSSFVNCTRPTSLSHPGAIVSECSERPSPKQATWVIRFESRVVN
jgi:hypothetical protein